MPIDVEWQKEDGTILARYLGPPVAADLIGSTAVGSVCLRFIDPYGDTLFNQIQIPVLIRELRALQAYTTDLPQLTALRELEHFLQQAQGKVHTYIRFLGD
jgi:hypothetical protein